MCDCDERGFCEPCETSAPCSICGRGNDGQRPGPLCRTCRATAKAGGRMLANAERYPDPERIR